MTQRSTDRLQIVTASDIHRWTLLSTSELLYGFRRSEVYLSVSFTANGDLTKAGRMVDGAEDVTETEDVVTVLGWLTGATGKGDPDPRDVRIAELEQQVAALNATDPSRATLMITVRQLRNRIAELEEQLLDSADRQAARVAELEQQVAGLTAALAATGNELTAAREDADRAVGVSEGMATVLGERDAAMAEALELMNDVEGGGRMDQRVLTTRQLGTLRAILTRFTIDTPKG